MPSKWPVVACASPNFSFPLCALLSIYYHIVRYSGQTCACSSTIFTSNYARRQVLPWLILVIIHHIFFCHIPFEQSVFHHLASAGGAFWRPPFPWAYGRFHSLAQHCCYLLLRLAGLVSRAPGCLVLRAHRRFHSDFLGMIIEPFSFCSCQM